MDFSHENSKSINNRAYCFAKLKMYNEAVSDYTRALALDPNNIHALHNRGICYERMGLYRNVRLNPKKNIYIYNIIGY
jgi:tetratricopeptide (TPR) repeat protein